MTQIAPVILCGGSGRRLWPVSRLDFAQQHAPIFDGRSPFQRMLERVAGDPRFCTPIVIAGGQGRFTTDDQARTVGVGIELALEPEGRGAAAALAVALAARRDPDAAVLVLPSDQLIPDVAAFRDAAAAASAATALITEGCLWSAGMFCLGTGPGCAEIERLAPEVADAVGAGLDGAADDLGALRLGEAFAASPKISFDYAVMEKTDRASVVAADFARSDIGDWREVWANAPRDADGVAAQGPVVAHSARDCYVRGEDRLFCASGVEGLAIVETTDAVLVAPLDRTQEVKALVGLPAGQGRAEVDTSARVHRSLGWRQTTGPGERFRVKRIAVTPGEKLSVQHCHHRAEHRVVVKGAAEVARDDEVILVRGNESVYPPQGCVDRLANPGRVPVEIIEVQTGAFLKEDDIIRTNDDFGRH